MKPSHSRSLVLLTFGLLAAACGGKKKSEPSATATPDTSASATPAPTPEPTPAPAAPPAPAKPEWLTAQGSQEVTKIGLPVPGKHKKRDLPRSWPAPTGESAAYFYDTKKETMMQAEEFLLSDGGWVIAERKEMAGFPLWIVTKGDARWQISFGDQAVKPGWAFLHVQKPFGE